MKIIITALYIVLVSFVAPMSLAVAKPMPPPKLGEAIRVENIIVVEYLGFKKSFSRGSTKDYFQGVTATYKIVDILKGVDFGIDQKIRVRYDFHDWSPCTMPPDWKFNVEIMPKKGEAFILFLKENRDGIWITYRGDWGRWSATEDNVDKIKDFLTNEQ